MKYRHLLVHECTYLNGAKLQELNSATRGVLEKLAEISGYKERFDYLVAESDRTYKGMSIQL